MRSFMSLLVSMLSLLLIHHYISFTSPKSVNFINQTCKKSAQSDPQLSYDFCVTSLQPVPGSHKASLRGLGIISVKLAIANATHTKSFVKKLMKNETSNRYARECLKSCLENYANAIPTLRHSVSAFKSKRYDDANIYVSSAMDSSTTCEEGFGEKKGYASPLTKENDNLFQLSAIALAITNLLA